MKKFLLLTLLAATAQAEVALPKILSDNMVLQRNVPDAFWGTAAPGESVTVSFAGKSATTTANKDGAWILQLGPFDASATPRDLEIKGTNTITLHNVLVGEVWLCSGQSNMVYAMGSEKEPTSTDPWVVPPDTMHRDPQMAVDLNAANDPQLRLFNMKKTGDAGPVTGQWQPTEPHALWGFSAIGYYFGKRLRQELNVPIGIVEAGVDGTRIEWWAPPEAFYAQPSMASQKGSGLVDGWRDPGNLWRSRVRPLAPYTLRGFLWYQGESNIESPQGAIHYQDKMEALITSWRTAWGGASLPFYFVQPAPLAYINRIKDGRTHPPDSYSELHEQQTLVLALPHTGMVVTTDLADNPNNIHPKYKVEVADRLVRWALNKDYGHTNLPYTGPVYRSSTISGNKIVLTFSHTEQGLQSRDKKPLIDFTIAGADNKFVPANAEIKGDIIIVSSPEVATPTAVRFACGELDNPNLINGAGLPAVPFRTDGPVLPSF